MKLYENRASFLNSWVDKHYTECMFSLAVKINANGFLIWPLSASQLGYPMSVTLIFLWLCSKFLSTHQNKHGDGTGQTTVKGVLQEGVCFSFPLIEFAWCLYIIRMCERERESAGRIMHLIHHSDLICILSCVKCTCTVSYVCILYNSNVLCIHNRNYVDLMDDICYICNILYQTCSSLML